MAGDVKRFDVTDHSHDIRHLAFKSSDSILIRDWIQSWESNLDGFEVKLLDIASSYISDWQWSWEVSVAGNSRGIIVHIGNGHE